MSKKKSKTKHRNMTKHRIRIRSASSESLVPVSHCRILLTLFPANWAPLTFTPSPRFNDGAINRWARKRATSKTKPTHPQPRAISLLDLPLELLYMIFDHVTRRDRRRRRRYKIRVVPEGASIENLSIAKHPLLMVCSHLRSALFSYLCSTCPLHVEIHMSSMIRNNHGILDLQQVQEGILHARKLSSVKLTITIHELSRKFFDYSVLLQMGTILFEEYREKKLRFKDEPKLVRLRWWLECNDPEFTCQCPRCTIEKDLRRLLKDIHKWAAKTAIHTSKSSQMFSSELERWLKTQEGTVDRTYYIRRLLDQCLRATSVSDRRVALESYCFRVKWRCASPRCCTRTARKLT